MNWTRIVEAGFVASLLASFTDWYFFGILFHVRYGSNRGVWRQYDDKKDEVRSIAAGTLLGAVTTFVFVAFCAYLRIITLAGALAAAGVIWVMVPIPLLLTNATFMRIDRRLVVSHSLGWLARLGFAGLCTAWFL